jgi:hypothetical protein
METDSKQFWDEIKPGKTMFGVKYQIYELIKEGDTSKIYNGITPNIHKV